MVTAGPSAMLHEAKSLCPAAISAEHLVIHDAILLRPELHSTAAQPHTVGTGAAVCVEPSTHAAPAVRCRVHITIEASLAIATGFNLFCVTVAVIYIITLKV